VAAAVRAAAAPGRPASRLAAGGPPTTWYQGCLGACAARPGEAAAEAWSGGRVVVVSSGAAPKGASLIRARPTPPPWPGA
jgi:hypothetical protein